MHVTEKTVLDAELQLYVKSLKLTKFQHPPHFVPIYCVSPERTIELLSNLSCKRSCRNRELSQTILAIHLYPLEVRKTPASDQGLQYLLIFFLYLPQNAVLVGCTVFSMSEILRFCDSILLSTVKVFAQ